MSDHRSSKEFDPLLDSAALGPDSDEYRHQLQEALRAFADSAATRFVREWEVARAAVEQHGVPPQFVWNLCSYVFGHRETQQQLPDGLVFGLRRLVLALCADPHLGSGVRHQRMPQALAELEPKSLAAGLFIHSFCRRLLKQKTSRLFRPIIEDALLRARLGIELWKGTSPQNLGLAAVAGFSTRAGLCVLLASGTPEQSGKALRLLAEGDSLEKVGRDVFGTVPRMVSGLLLLLSGFGRPAAFGVVGPEFLNQGSGAEESWSTNYEVIECIRAGVPFNEEQERLFQSLGFSDPAGECNRMREVLSQLRRAGHGLDWLIAS